MQKIMFLVIAAVLLLSSPGHSTVVEANGFPSLYDCGEGLAEIEGFHSGVLNLVSIEDDKKDWFLTGRLWKCSFFFPREVAVFCTARSNTSIKTTLYCSQFNTETCRMVEDGIHTRTLVTILRGPSDSSESPCTSIRCTSSASLLPPDELSSKIPLGHPRPGEPLPVQLQQAIDEGEPFPFHLKSEQIPDFSVVAQFYRYASWVITRRGHVRDRFLQHLQIEQQSPVETFFAKMMDQATLILNRPTIDRTLEGKAFMEHQYAALRQKAADLGALHRELLAGLEDVGISRETLEAFCEQFIRPTMQTFSTEIDNSRYLETLQAFNP